ncbi:FHA domain-containing protein [Fischerella thermalis]|jgi:pSer/pThr/pTyr-binding forkhead associated (FHA) protein|uniref:FHA domain containing protein n=2 Tax=Fischerella TaxID=1190 RepID=G6FN78_9CYAN|nr:FHA domain-containing protein [Fischerella thermalis]EHC19508.1 FHA domain containing protein [Fischerella thermalis JSC-11]PLZ11037.1 peptide-binding protein [Fischerella thermalis WC1110]PLZ34772.1 peptide-binding protein [Fischerella thermalis WC558]PLZ41543.1 peptide-binding protein [Fischerella thermalis WC542]PLZ42900.1 peptide-binding protein [Fischerella thermalis WC538]
MIAEFSEKELEKRLSLYQVFLKLYEHHSSFLDEILQLENLPQPLSTGVQGCYLQGVIDSSDVYVITNLSEGKTQKLLQPQYIWTIGRDRTCGICVCDRRVSRRHAAIQYIENADYSGFYLVDFSSTNGTFVNGEPVYRPIKLQDGDHIRLGSMTFSFYMNLTPPQVLPRVAVELLMQLVTRKSGDEVQINRKVSLENLDHTLEAFRQIPILNSEEIAVSLSQKQQSEILDNFFSKQMPSNSR